MRFVVQKDVFEKLNNVCFGVVVARGIDNSRYLPEVKAMLDDSMEAALACFDGVKVKEHGGILPYRNAFTSLGINPNKFMCSIEALMSRIAKGNRLPNINNIVDLGNAVSLRHILPIGAHDMDQFAEDMEIRFAREGDKFIPFGSNEAENVEPGELVYASGSDVKTRKWIWRQSEHGKITESSRNIFFPIDGFAAINDQEVLKARDEIAEAVKKVFGCEVKTGFVDVNHPFMEL